MTEAAQAATRPLGLVPTMGYLHDGHLALVRRGRAENATLVASIFVNPAQFGPREDFSTYPRDMASDLARLEHEGVDIVFAPSEDEMYPAGFDTWVTVGALGRQAGRQVAPRSLQRRRHRGLQAAHDCAAGPGLLRSEGHPADRRRNPDGRRPQPRGGGRRRPHGARA